MNKFDYYYARGVSKFLNATELMVKCFVPTKSKGLTSELDIPYGDDKNQRLDIFYDAHCGTGKRPIYFYIHGGGFISGKRCLRRPYCCNMARQGFFVVNIDYRPSPKVHFPDTFNDIFKAIDYVLEKSKEYNLDLDNIVIGGESAGAYFSTYITLMTLDKSLYEQFSIDFQHKNDFKINSVVLINGAYYIPDILNATTIFNKAFVKAFFNLTNKDLKNEQILNKKEYCPMNYIGSDFPYTIVIKGKYDVFKSGSDMAIRVFDSKGVKYSTFTAKGFVGLHAVSIAPICKNARDMQNFTALKLKENLNNISDNLNN